MNFYGTKSSIFCAQDKYDIELAPIDSKTTSVESSITSKIANLFISCINVPCTTLKIVFNTCLIGWSGEVLKPFSWYHSPNKWMFHFPHLIGNWHVTSIPQLGDAVLRLPRDGELCQIEKSTGPFLDIVCEVVPGATKDDAFFFADEDHAKLLRKPIARALKTQTDWEKKMGALAHQFDEDFICRNVNQELDGFSLFRTYAANLLCKVGFRYEATWEQSESIARAIDGLQKYALGRFFSNALGYLGSDPTEEEKEECQNDIKTLQIVLENIVEKTKEIEGSFVHEMFKNRMSEIEVKCALISILQGGIRNPTQHLNFTLWQLGQDDKLQAHFSGLNANEQSAFIEQLLKESFRYFTPANSLVRQFKKDVELKIINVTRQSEVFSQVFHKGDSIFYVPFLAGRNEQLFDHPDKFDLGRYEDEKNDSKIHEFGRGVNMCPGRYLERASFKALTKYLLSKYTIRSSPNNITYMNKDVLMPKETIMLTFIPKE